MRHERWMMIAVEGGDEEGYNGWGRSWGMLSSRDSRDRGGQVGEGTPVRRASERKSQGDGGH